MHGIQAWVALPERDEGSEPVFAHYGGADLPVFEDGGASARLIAGDAFGVSAKVKTHSPMFYLHWALEPGARVQLPAAHPERAVYVATGSGLDKVHPVKDRLP